MTPEYSVVVSDTTGRKRMHITVDGEIWIDPTGIEEAAQALVTYYSEIVRRPIHAVSADQMLVALQGSTQMAELRGGVVELVPSFANELLILLRAAKVAS